MGESWANAHAGKEKLSNGRTLEPWGRASMTKSRGLLEVGRDCMAQGCAFAQQAMAEVAMDHDNVGKPEVNRIRFQALQCA